MLVNSLQRYICVKECVAEQGDELSLNMGDIVTLKGKGRDGWWEVV